MYISINYFIDILDNIPNQLRNKENEENKIIIVKSIDLTKLLDLYNTSRNTLLENYTQKTLWVRNGKSHIPTKEIINYYKNNLCDIVLKILQEHDKTITILYPTPDDDISSCLIIQYDRKIDRIGWHYDNNYYRNSRYFTVLIPLEITDINNVSMFCYMDNKEEKKNIIGINDIIIFEGNKLYHRASLNKTNNKRIILSCTYITNQTTTINKTFKIFKNFTFI